MFKSDPSIQGELQRRTQNGNYIVIIASWSG